MVQRQPNGDLTWLQDGGHIVTVSPEDPAQYSPALETEDMQINAQLQNTTNKNAYSNELAIAQVNVDASRPIPGIPVKPEYIIVTDPVMNGTTVTAGKAAKVPWPPPGLPDLQHKMVYKSGASAPTEEPFVIEPPAVEHHEEAASAPHPKPKK